MHEDRACKARTGPEVLEVIVESVESCNEQSHIDRERGMAEQAIPNKKGVRTTVRGRGNRKEALSILPGGPKCL